MICGTKKKIILALESPLILLGVVVKILIAILTFICLRWVMKGIFYGKKLNTYIESHELGYKKEK